MRKTSVRNCSYLLDIYTTVVAATLNQILWSPDIFFIGAWLGALHIVGRSPVALTPFGTLNVGENGSLR